MRKEALGLLSAFALMAAACSSPTARGSAPQTTPPSPVESVTRTASAGLSTGSPGAAAPATTLDVDRSVPPSTDRSTPSPTSLPPGPTSTAAPDDEPIDLGFDDEPVFDAEPLQPLDLSDVPVDDAGLGSPDAGVAEEEPVTGWSAFDADLASSLLVSGNTSASVAVSIGGDVVHAAAFGARIPGTFETVGVDDRFRVASISKTITSITLLQLVEQGLVGLDEPIGDRVAVHLGMTNASGGSQRLTLRQLLTHTSGFGKYQSVFFRNGSTDCRHAASIGLSQGGGGGGYQYSNMNYCIAGQLIEALTGRDYEAVVYEQLLTPLGLSGLRLAPTFDPGPGETQHVTTAGRNYMETLGAAGAWIASPTDLVTILDSLDPSTPGWRPLDDLTLLAMLTPVYGQFGQRGYGMGMIMYGGGRFGHTGTIENTHAMVLNRGDGVTWSITVAGPHPSDTPNLERIINQAFEAGGFVAA
jgi:D-alanyl-D-alanine carboxypeptidase